jgi:hypothetical protein
MRSCCQLLTKYRPLSIEKPISLSTKISRVDSQEGVPEMHWEVVAGTVGAGGSDSFFSTPG